MIIMLTREDLSAIADILDYKLVPINNRLDHFEQRFEKVDEKFDKIDERFEKIDEKFDKIDERFEKIDKKFDKIDEHFEKIDERFERIDQRLEKNDEKYDQLEDRFTKLENAMSDGFRKIHIVLENEIKPSIALLAENYLPAAIRYESAMQEHESMKLDIDLLKRIVAEHSEKLQKIS